MLLELRQTILKRFAVTADLMKAILAERSRVGNWGLAANEPIREWVREFERGEKRQYLSREEIIGFARHAAKSEYLVAVSIISRVLLINRTLGRFSFAYECLSEDINDFRFIVERVAILSFMLDELNDKELPTKIRTYYELVDVGGCVTILHGTRFDWRSAIDKTFQEMASADYKKSELDLGDLNQSQSILKMVDRMHKRHTGGLRPFYNFCSDFVHPNMGDVLSVSLDATTNIDRDGAILITRKLEATIPNLAPKLAGVPNHDAALLFRCYEFFPRVMDRLDEMLPALLDLLRTSQRVGRLNVHKIVKRNRSLFSRNDLCPCGSGRSIERCQINARA